MTTIKLKNGSGAPLAGDLVQGEPALDLTNKRLYTEDSSGTVIEVGTNPSTINIDAGTIDGTVIGGSTAAAGTFTTGQFNTSLNVDGTVTADGYSSANQTPDIQITRSSSGTAIQTGPNITFSDGTTNNTTTLQVTQGRFGVWNYGGGSWLERMAIDASGNLLVGHTSLNGTGGVDIGTSGYVRASRSGDEAAIFNRETNDGTIVRLQKDGTTVGSIASRSGVVTSLILNPSVSAGAGITEANTGAGPSVSPTNGSGATADASIDLGTSSIRWQDLHMSGNAFIDGNVQVAAGNGILLGGTATANKLDDYEEGTWTPALTGNSAVTYSNQVGIYTKIGNTVVAKCYLNMSAWTGTGDSVNITGLPFAANTSLAIYGGNAIMVDNLTSDENAVICQVTPGGTNATVLGNVGRTNSHAGLAGTQVQAASEFRATIIYQTA